MSTSSLTPGLCRGYPRQAKFPFLKFTLVFLVLILMISCAGLAISFTLARGCQPCAEFQQRFTEGLGFLEVRNGVFSTEAVRRKREELSRRTGFSVDKIVLLGEGYQLVKPQELHGPLYRVWMKYHVPNFGSTSEKKFVIVELKGEECRLTETRISKRLELLYELGRGAASWPFRLFLILTSITSGGGVVYLAFRHPTQICRPEDKVIAGAKSEVCAPIASNGDPALSPSPMPATRGTLALVLGAIGVALFPVFIFGILAALQGWWAARIVRAHPDKFRISEGAGYGVAFGVSSVAVGMFIWALLLSCGSQILDCKLGQEAVDEYFLLKDLLGFIIPG